MRIYLDSNIFIYAYECETDLGHAARRAFALIDERDAVGVTSELTLAEVLPRPLKEQNAALEHAYEAVFHGRQGMETYPLCLSILRLSAPLVAQSSLRQVDALHVATAIDAACDVFLTEDRRVRVPAGVRLLNLSDRMFS